MRTTDLKQLFDYGYVRERLFIKVYPKKGVFN